MSDLYLLVRVTVNQAQVDKMNAKRTRLGRQTATAAEEAINIIGGTLQHNWIFEPGSVRVKEIEVNLAKPHYVLVGE